jgi:hypothetical protein
MVKFQKRKLTRRYKHTEHNYYRFLIELPTELNPEIEPHQTKEFDRAIISFKETTSDEILNIALVKNKTNKESDKTSTA